MGAIFPEAATHVDHVGLGTGTIARTWVCWNMGL